MISPGDNEIIGRNTNEDLEPSKMTDDDFKDELIKIKLEGFNEGIEAYSKSVIQAFQSKAITDLGGNVTTLTVIEIIRLLKAMREMSKLK